MGNSPLKPTFDIIIVGGGIVGAACADACARAGLKVLVLDRGPVGGGTTGAGMGHLVVMDDSEAQFTLTCYSRQLWIDLIPDLPAAVEFDQCGTLWVAADEQEMAEVRRKEDYYRQRAVRVEVLDAHALAAAEPNLRGDLVGGLRVVEDGVIYPPGAARCLIESAIAHKARLQTGVEVTAILPEGGVVLADGSRIFAGVVVNAAGPWSPALIPGLPIHKRKGHLAITDRYPNYIHHQIIELGYLKSAHSVDTDSVAFNVQCRKTGQILIGSSRQYSAEGTEINNHILERMLQRALVYMPGLAKLSLTRCWTGHRAATPDKLPLIGPTPDNSRIWLATGHEGLGITTSLGTGKLLADLLLERPTDIPAEPYAPARLLRARESTPQLCATT